MLFFSSFHVCLRSEESTLFFKRPVKDIKIMESKNYTIELFFCTNGMSNSDLVKEYLIKKFHISIIN